MKNHKSFFFRVLPLALSPALILVAGCGAGTQEQPPVTGTELAVVTTGAFRSAAEGGPVGAHAVVSTDNFSKQENILPTPTSDIGVSANGGYFYRIEKYNGDNIAKFDAANPAQVIWNYKTLDDGDTVTSNPYALIAAGSNKAYILRYGKPTAWIVDPNATSQASFKHGELNLSAYSDEASVPEMSDALVVAGKLYISTQNMDANFTPGAAFVAVYDTTTDLEIDTNPSAAPHVDNRLGIALPIKNPGKMTYSTDTGKIYIAGIGKYGFPSYGIAAEYTGGIAVIDPLSYQATLLIDDGDATNHPYGNIVNVAVVDASHAYFVGYFDYRDNSLFEFNPQTGAVAASTIVSGKDISCLGVDGQQRLWVCAGPGTNDPSGTKPSLMVVDPATGNVIHTTDLSMNATDIAFVKKNP